MEEGRYLVYHSPHSTIWIADGFGSYANGVWVETGGHAYGFFPKDGMDVREVQNLPGRYKQLVGGYMMLTNFLVVC